MALPHYILEVIGMIFFVLMDIPRLLACAAIRLQLPRCFRNVRYAPGTRCFCDVYDDAGSSEPCSNVILFVHGGAWAFGDKWIHADICKLLSSSRCPVVAANYSLWPEGDIRAATHDVAAAIGLHAPRICTSFSAHGIIVGSPFSASVVQQQLERHMPPFA
jgi:hypothetical protein